MATGGASIGALRVVLGIETANFEAGTKRVRSEASKTASALKSTLGGVGGVLKSALAGFGASIGVAGLIALTKSGLEYAGSLGEISQQIGVTARDLQVFREIGRQNGVTVEELDKGLQKFVTTLGKAGQGNKQAIASFANIGVGLADVKSKDPHTLLMRFMDDMKATSDEATRNAKAVALMGKAGAQLKPALILGSEGFAAFADAAERAGLVLSDELINRADQAADKFERVKQQLGVRIASTVAENAGAIESLADAFAHLVVNVGNAISVLSNFGNLRAFKAGSSGAGVELLKSQSGREALLANIQSRLQENIQRRASGKSRHDTPLTNQQIEKLDHDFVALNRMRNAVFKAGIAANRPRPQPKLSADRQLGSAERDAAGKEAAAAARKAASEAKRAAREALQAEKDYQGRLGQVRSEILGAEADLTSSETEKARLSAEQLEIERQDSNKNIELDEKLSQIRKAELTEQNDKLFDLRQQAVSRDLAIQQARAAIEVQQAGYDNERDLLQARAALALRTKDKLAAELGLLDLQFKAEEERLRNTTLLNGYGEEEVRIARERLGILGQLKSVQAQGIRQSNAGPLEQFRNELNATDINEQLEQIQVDGMKGLAEGLQGIVAGTESVSSAFKKMANSIISDLIRIALQKAVMGLIGSLFGGGGGFQGFGSSYSFGKIPLPGFATGGSFRVGGSGGIDSQLIQFLGSPGEMVDIRTPGNDNGGRSGGMKVEVVPSPYFDVRVTEISQPIADRAQQGARRDTLDTISRSHGRAVPTLARRR